MVDQPPNFFILAVQHPIAALIGVVEQPRLVRVIAVEIRVAVEVIGAEVEQNPHRRLEPLDIRQLERAHLGYDPLVSPATLGGQLREGEPDVAAHADLNACRSEQRARPRRGRGFPVRPRYRDHWRLEEVERQLELGDHLLASNTRRGENRGAGRYARAHDQQVAASEPILIVAPQVHVGARPHQLARVPVQLLAIRHIAGVDPRSCGGQQPRGRAAAAAQPENSHPQARPVPAFHHLTFNVLSAISAQSTPAIQKRTTTFDSDHPSCSK
jgi:hypothetical protein